MSLVITMTVVTATEWYARFARYHFEMQLFHLPTRAQQFMASQRSSSLTNQVPAISGGDLSAMIGIHRVAQPYQEWRDAGFLIKDGLGYVNHPYDSDKPPYAVVVGDSFMAKGLVDEIFATRLTNLSGKFIYNRALIGHGPFISVQNFLDDPRYKDNPPEFLIWGFAEREINGHFFERFYNTLVGYSQLSEPVPGRVDDVPEETHHLIVHWDSFTPSKLKQSLPASSLLAQSAHWIWNRARSLLFGQVHPDLVPANGDVIDGPMLFYRYHIESLGLSSEARNVPVVIQAITELDALCRSRGIRLIVVLIPEKEQTYRDWIPRRFNRPGNPLPPSSLWTLAPALQQRGVLVVNLLPVFNEATARGERVYWRDDTHWNVAGVDLAVNEVWKLMQAQKPIEDGQ